jgi:hypothetical protein
MQSLQISKHQGFVSSKHKIDERICFFVDKQKRPTEVSLCCRGIPRVYWLRRLDLN